MKNLKFRCFAAILVIATMFLAFTACSNDDGEEEDITAHFDAKFAEFLQEQSLISDAHKIKKTEVDKITVLYVVGEELTSLAGIEYFESLTELNCYMNKLTTLDVSKNTKLDKLYCWSNKLTTLDVSKNTALTILGCHDNQLTSLAVSKNTVMIGLSCHHNQLTALEVIKNTALTDLDCSYNQLTTLDISKNTKLKEFDCKTNPGDGLVFIVKAWFDNNNVPNTDHFTTSSWEYPFLNGDMITIDYQKVN
jgi:hypothetical protein